MGTTTSDTTFVVSKDGEYIKWMRMSLWKRTCEKADRIDRIKNYCEQQLRVMDVVRKTIIDETGFGEYVEYHQFSIEALINVHMKILGIIKEVRE